MFKPVFRNFVLFVFVLMVSGCEDSSKSIISNRKADRFKDENKKRMDLIGIVEEKQLTKLFPFCVTESKSGKVILLDINDDELPGFVFGKMYEVSGFLVDAEEELPILTDVSIKGYLKPVSKDGHLEDPFASSK